MGLGLTGLVVLLSVTTLAAFAAERWWVLELLSNLRLQHTLALVLLALVLLALRRVAAGVVALVAAAINLVVVGPVLVASQWGDAAPAAPEAATLEVTFFNTKIVHADMQRTIEVLAARDDDVVVLAGGTKAWVEALEAADLDLEVLLGPHTHEGTELIALARAPGAEAVLHEVTDESRDVLVEVATELDGRPVRVLGTHVVSPLTPERAARRDAMLEWIPDWVARSDDPAVVVGDLNATPWSPVLGRVTDRAGLVDSQVGHGLQPSYPAALGPLGIPIDHILHTGELTTLARSRGPALGSDHPMIHATLAPRGEDGQGLTEARRPGRR